MTEGSFWMALERRLARIESRLDTRMSEDAAIQAVTADIQTQLTSLSALITQVLAEIKGSGNNSVQPSTVAALQAAQASLDSTVAGFSTDLNPPATGTTGTAPASGTATGAETGSPLVTGLPEV